MLRPIVAATAILALPAAIPTAAFAEVPLPTGSYLSSCKVLSFDAATGHLQADCSGENVSFLDGRPTTPAFNATGCKEGSIWNDNRQLYCYSQTAWGNDRVIPPGSYIASCTDRKVVGGALLVATCGMPGGSSKNASLDLRGCEWGGDISNQNGSLRCKSLPSPLAKAVLSQPLANPAQDQGVVKLAPVEPGVVKPAVIAPLSPVEPGVTEDDGDGRKKKRRRNRGERG